MLNGFRSELVTISLFPYPFLEAPSTSQYITSRARRRHGCEMHSRPISDGAQIGDTAKNGI